MNRSTKTFHQSLLLLLNAESALQVIAFLPNTRSYIVPDVLYWRLLCPNRGRRPLNYIDVIGRDTEAEIVDLPNMMRDKHLWRHVVHGISVATAEG